jgi:hypothetical protein
MCPDKPDPNDFVRVVDSHNQSVMIAFDVKYYPVVLQKTGTGVIGFYVSRAIPNSVRCFLKPGFQLLLAVWMFCPKIPKGLFRDYSQCSVLPKIIKVPELGNAIFGREFIKALRPTYEALRRRGISIASARRSSLLG